MRNNQYLARQRTRIKPQPFATGSARTYIKAKSYHVKEKGHKSAAHAHFHKVNKVKAEIQDSLITANKEVTVAPKDLVADLGKLGTKVGDFFTKTKWGRRAGYVGLTVIAFNLLKGSYNAFFEKKHQMPEEFDRGYDVLQESLTDFGSPHKSKVAQKVMIPYYSTPRNSIYTTTESVIASNPSLASYKHAIKHGRY